MIYIKAILLLAICFVITGCDTFFEIHATVIDASTERPLSNATATLVLDQGIGEEDIISMTNHQGQINLLMNEPEQAWATLTIQKEGFATWTKQFQGAPKHPVVIRLNTSNTD